MLIRCSLFFASFLLSVPLHAQGVNTVEVGNVQLARSLTAVVHDSGGTPMAGVLVEELSSDWKESLRSTKTDVADVFYLRPRKGPRSLLFPTYIQELQSASRSREAKP
jgi:hypothetical protein